MIILERAFETILQDLFFEVVKIYDTGVNIAESRVSCPDPELDSTPKLHCHVNNSNFLSCDVDCESNLRVVILNNTMLYRTCELSKDATPQTACWILVLSGI